MISIPSTLVHAVAAAVAAPAVATPLESEIPVSTKGAQIVVEGVMLNGRGPYRFLLDTGAQGQGRIDVSVIEQLKLAKVGEVGTSDGSGRPGPRLPLHAIDSLSVGDLRFTGLQVVARDYNAAPSVEARGRIDGVLGLGLFADRLLTLDYGRGVIRVGTGALPPADGATVLPLLPGSAAPSVEVQVGGRKAAARIDTGSMGGVTLGGDVARDLPMTAVDGSSAVAVTVAGAAPMRSYRLEGDLRLGAHVRKTPQVAVVEPFKGVNLGGGVLRDYVTTLDQLNRRIRFVPASSPHAAANPPQAATSPGPVKRYGFLLSPPAAGADTLPLLGAAPGSIAEKAGFKAGDVVLSLNGVPVKDAVPTLATLMRSSPLTVTFRRDGEVRTQVLTLD